MKYLLVDADQAYNTAHALGNDAVELREELAGLERDWDNLSRGWSGVASSAYADGWKDWLESAITLVDVLTDLSHNLGLAAVRYSEQDSQSAALIASVPMDLGI